MIWANVTRFGKNFIAPKIFWADTPMNVTATQINLSERTLKQNEIVM